MTPNRASKIIATLGPASGSREVIAALAARGADVFRLNFSHGTHADHAARLAVIREVEAASGRPIGVLLDLQGPKLRIGTFENGRVTLQAGARFVFDSDPTAGHAQRVRAALEG